MTSRVGTLLLCGLGLALPALSAACAAPPPPVPPAYPETIETHEAILEIRKRTAGVRAIRADIVVESERGRLRGHLWAEADGRLRIQAQRLLWNAFDLLIDGDRVTLHMPRRAKVLSASVPDLGVRGGPLIASRDLLRALMGSAGSRIAVFDEEGRNLTLAGGAPGGRREVWIYDRKHLLLRRLERYSPEGKIELEVDVGGYRPFEGRWWPSTAVLKTSSKRMEIELEEIETNPPLQPDVFRIDLPEGTVIVERMEDLDE